MPSWLIDEMARLFVRRGLSPARGSTLLFATAAGTPLNYTNWRRDVWIPARQKAELPSLKFHDLRSMAATALIAAGVDVKTTQRRLGRSSPQVTLALYARATAAADRAAADLLGERFRPRDGRAMSQGLAEIRDTGQGA